MADKELKIKISADDQLSPAMEKALQNVAGLNTGLINLSAGLSVATIAFDILKKGIQVASEVLKESIHEALEGEKAQNRLAGALVQTGNYTAEVNKSLNAYAESLEATVGANGEAVRGMIATGLQMGLTIEKSKQLEQASRQLAAANGISNEEAFSALQSSLAGQSRALGKLIPQVKELGSAQLKQGEAIDIVVQSTKAQYDLYQQSLPAAIEKVSTASGNMYKAIGQIITQNPAIKASVTAVAEAFTNFTSYIEKNQSAISEYVSKGLKNFAIAASGVVSIFGDNTVSKALDEYVVKLQTLDSQAQMGIGTTKESTEAHLEEVSAINKKKAAIETLYDGYAIGTSKQREALTGEMQQRDSDLKDFTGYLDAKKRLAVTKADEQEMEVNKVRAAALKGVSGGESGEDTAQAAIDAESKKQAGLQVLRAKGVLNEREYQEALRQSQDAAAIAQYEQDTANNVALQTALGNTEEGFQLKLQTEEGRWQLENQQRLAHAQAEMADQTQINQLKEQMNLEFLAKVNSDKEAQIQNEIALNEKAGNNFAASVAKVRLEQQKHGVIMGAIRGVQQTEEFQATNQALGNLSTLRTSNSKEAFEVGQAAAIAQATINTFMAATAAYSSLAGIPLVGPALGAIAAGAAVAAGVINIQKITSTKFNPGGQAHDGMTEIPSSLDNKSFVLAGGERVVSSNQNADLKKFLNDQKQGNTNSSNYNVTLNYAGNGSKGDAETMADMIITEIRRRSERGTPVISQRGVTS